MSTAGGAGERSTIPAGDGAAPAGTPKPPYYAVVFASVRTATDEEGYGATAERMLSLAKAQPGYLGIESVRGGDGFGITVSYWASLDDIRAWAAVPDHREAQRLGREIWYRRFRLRVCRVESETVFEI